MAAGKTVCRKSAAATPLALQVAFDVENDDDIS